MKELEKLLRELNVCKAELKKYELLYQADSNTTKEEFAELKKHQDRVDMLILKIEDEIYEGANKSSSIAPDILAKIERDLKGIEQKIMKNNLSSKESDKIKSVLDGYRNAFEKKEDYSQEAYWKIDQLLDILLEKEDDQFVAEVIEAKQKQKQIINQPSKKIESLIKKLNEELSTQPLT